MLFYKVIQKNYMNIKTYIQETRAELKQVKWPTMGETIRVTIAVIAVSVFVAGILGLFDFGFASILKKIIGL